jgi:ArsR family transcriptional regulator, arsenate/arsenite/antimonite-responsive transcriptional repressor
MFELIGGSTVSTTTAKTKLDAIFKALASEHRRKILRILSDSTPQPGKTCCAADETCGCRLSDRLGLSAPTISHHMSVLRTAGLVDSRKDGLWTYYTLRRDVLGEAAEELRAL